MGMQHGFPDRGRNTIEDGQNPQTIMAFPQLIRYY